MIESVTVHLQDTVSHGTYSVNEHSVLIQAVFVAYCCVVESPSLRAMVKHAGS
jgi:hypothetical protein